MANESDMLTKAGKTALYEQAKSAALDNLYTHGLKISPQFPDLHLFAVSKLLTELDGIVAEVECTDVKAEEV